MFGIDLKEIKEDTSVIIPSSIFVDRSLAPLESITEYLIDSEGLTYHEIAVILNRDDRTIWTCYNRAQKKRQTIPKPAMFSQQSVELPATIFQDRTLAPLESISLFLKEQQEMTYHEIAVLVGRNDRTIWTCYNRAKKKLVGVIAK